MDIQDLAPILPAPVGRTTDFGSVENSANAAAADFDSFLTLLTAQLRNQDPLSPLDSTEFVAQLASFSSVEQAVQTNERLEALVEQSLNADIAVFASWIGRDVVAADGTFRSTGEGIAFTVPEKPGTAEIRATVQDATSGTELRTFTVNPDAQGNAAWDGLDSDGIVVPPSVLRIDLRYMTEDGVVASTVQAEIMRRVSGIRGTPDGILLDLADGGSIAPDTVSRLNEAGS